jgi:hypothetical protein
MTCPTYSIRICPWKALLAHRGALAQTIASATTASQSFLRLILVFICLLSDLLRRISSLFDRLQ